MELESPCSPGHCLGMLNAHMRTDVLRSVHEYVLTCKERHDPRSPLELLIEALQHTLSRYPQQLSEHSIGPNPFNNDGRYQPFNPTADYRHDRKLLNDQLAGLQRLYDSIDPDYFKHRLQQD